MNNTKITYLNYNPKPVKKEFYETKWINSLLKIASVILEHFPPLKRFIAKTAGGMLGRARQNFKAENFNEGYQICIDGLRNLGRKLIGKGIMIGGSLCDTLHSQRISLMKKIKKLNYYQLQMIAKRFLMALVWQTHFADYQDGNTNKRNMKLQ